MHPVLGDFGSRKLVNKEGSCVVEQRWGGLGPLPGPEDQSLWGRGVPAQAVAWGWCLVPLLHPDFPVLGLPRALGVCL